jgi:transcriptional regulator of acetoin/glycerol metabolism
MEKIRTTRMTATATAPTLTAATNGVASVGQSSAPPGLDPGQLAERSRIIAALVECSYNQKLAAARLKISRGTLFSRMRRYAIPGPRAATKTAAIQ